eukprot:31156-Pelagococcus_subviridis.AAC.5
MSSSVMYGASTHAIARRRLPTSACPHRTLAAAASTSLHASAASSRRRGGGINERRQADS